MIRTYQESIDMKKNKIMDFKSRQTNDNNNNNNVNVSYW